MDKITTMKLLRETKDRLEKLRENRRETFDDLVRKVLYVLNTVRGDPDRAKKILEIIDERRQINLKEEEEKATREVERAKKLSGKKKRVVNSGVRKKKNTLSKNGVVEKSG